MEHSHERGSSEDRPAPHAPDPPSPSPDALGVDPPGDLEAVLQRIAVRVAEALSCSCSVQLYEHRSNTWPLVALHHPDPAIATRLRELTCAAPDIGRDIPLLVREADARDDPILVADLPSLLDAHLPGLPKAVIQELYAVAALAVPLRTTREIIGFLTVIRYRPARPFEAADRAFLHATADVASLTVQNARLAAAAQIDRQRLSALFDQMHDPACFVDATQTVQRVNRSWCAFFGIPEQDAVGRHLREMHTHLNIRQPDGTPRPFADNALMRALATGATQRRRSLMTTGHGDRVVEVSVSPIVDANGTVSGVVNVYRDVTEQQHREDRQREHVATVAHDLRNPVGVILGYAQHARDELSRGRWRPAALHVSLDAIVRQTTRLARLIERYLDADLLEHGRLQVQPFPTDLIQLVRNTVERFLELPDRPTIVLDVPSAPVVALAEPERIDQVVSNLLENAVAHTPTTGQIRVSLRFVEGEPESAAEIAIADTGDGIAEDVLPRLFTRFARSASSSRSRRGSGLGLYICKGIVEAHGGRIWVTSAVGKGSTFYIRLPGVTREESSIDRG